MDNRPKKDCPDCVNHPGTKPGGIGLCERCSGSTKVPIDLKLEADAQDAQDKAAQIDDCCGVHHQDTTETNYFKLLLDNLQTNLRRACRFS